MTDLHPDLSRCLRMDHGRLTLNHPLLIAARYDPEHAVIYNREYEAKLAEVELAEIAGNWPAVIWLHERPFRPAALQRLSGVMTEPQYWTLVREVWLDATDHDPPRWTAIWGSRRRYREQVMTNEEHFILGQLRPTVAIYRGSPSPDLDGLAYRRTRLSAIQDGFPYLITARVEKRHIRAIIIGDDDESLIVLPKHCTMRRSSRVRSLIAA